MSTTERTDLRSLPTMDMAHFNASVLNQGRFAQFSLAPFESTEAHYQKALVVTEHVDEPTALTYTDENDRTRMCALLLPHLDELTFLLAQDYCRMHTSWFGVRDSATKELLATVREGGVSFAR